jgi:hypothetical protein
MFQDKAMLVPTQWRVNELDTCVSLHSLKALGLFFERYTWFLGIVEVNTLPNLNNQDPLFWLWVIGKLQPKVKAMQTTD